MLTDFIKGNKMDDDTLNVSDVVKALNKPGIKFRTMLEEAYWNDKEHKVIRGLVGITADTELGKYWYHVFFYKDSDKEEFILEEEAPYLDGLWGVAGFEVINDEDELAIYEVPEGFPPAAYKPDIEKLKSDLKNYKYPL